MSDKKDVMLKKKLISAKKAIQKKFKQLHEYHVALDEHVSENFRPIIRPLKELVDIKKKETTEPTKKIKDEPKVEKEEPQSQSKKKKKNGGETPTGHAASSKTSRKLSFDSDAADVDDEAGVFSTPKTTPSASSTKYYASTRKKVSLGTPWVTNKHYSVQTDLKTNDMVLGKHRMDVVSDKIRIGKKVFKSTPGLLNLLLLSKPMGYTDEDLNVYKQILNYTNVHKDQFHPDGEIILFPEKRGAALALPTDYMIHDRNEKTNFTYWDDPNELVDRLKLLVASQSAGHTGHNNEILSIIEELREAKIIK